MEMTSSKTVIVFVVIFGCFAVLYPKIFHPMLLHVLGFSKDKPHQDDMMNRIPPHLRKGPSGQPMGGDDVSRHMRQPGPHPGLRAAAELKKQAAQTGRDGGGGKGMMGVVLPMYAVGIVVYLIYTLSKVFGREKNKENPTPDYLGGANPFKDIQYDAEDKKFVQSHDFEKEDLRDNLKGLTQSKLKQRDLERLLLKADERNINEKEMFELKSRLLETEAQMSRILKAMEAVQSNVTEMPEDLISGYAKNMGKTADSSPDMDSYDIVSGKSNPSSPSIEDLGSLDGMDVGGNLVDNYLSREGQKSHAMAAEPKLNIAEMSKIDADKEHLLQQAVIDAEDGYEEDGEDDDEEENEELSGEYDDGEYDDGGDDGDDGDDGDEEVEVVDEDDDDEESEGVEYDYDDMDDDGGDGDIEEEENVDLTLKDTKDVSSDEEHPDLRKRLPPQESKKSPDQ